MIDEGKDKPRIETHCLPWAPSPCHRQSVVDPVHRRQPRRRPYAVEDSSLGHPPHTPTLYAA
jgi:hypothetical protein